VPAPPNFHWVLTVDDEFTQDTSLNTNLWANGSTSDTISFDSEGLHIQNTKAANGCGVNSPEYPQCAAGIGTGAMFSPRFGFWEWSAKIPRTNDGSGDGYHFDTYINNNISSDRTGYQEVGIGETYTYGSGAFGDYYCCGNSTDGNATVDVQIAINNPCCTSDAFHTISVWWFDDGVGNGAVSSYYDGSSLYEGGRQGTWWGSGGATIIMNNIVCNLGGCDGTTATSGNPLSYKYFRYWVLAAN
jgi:hypothetical protein